MFKLWSTVIKILPVASNSLKVTIVHARMEGSTDLSLPSFMQFITPTYEKLTVLSLNPVHN